MNVLDLFSGIGGFSLGLERAGMRTVAFCEVDPYCCAVLKKRWPDVPCYGDIRELDAAKLASDSINVDLICGGFPCQDISVAGRGAGLAGGRSGLWTEYARLIRELRPRYVIVENVSALLSRGLGTVLGDLAAIGYDAEWHCIRAADVGAPHLRDRIWIIAHPQHPNADGERSYRAALYEQRGAELRDEQISVSGPLGEALADTDSTGLSQRRQAGESTSTDEKFGGMALPKSERCGGSWWAVEPDVGRVAHGIPKRVDRLRCLGNAVVPQIPEIIGRAIMRTKIISATESAHG